MAKWQMIAGAAGVVSALAIGTAACGAFHPQAGGGPSGATASAQPGGGTGAQGGSTPTAAPAAAQGSAAPGSAAPEQAASGVPAGGPVPAGFAATSVTWVSTQEAFVLGTAPCATPPCTSIVRTLNRGASWRGLPAPVVPLHWPDTSRPAVWGIRFGTPSHGFVFGNGLWETRDGGEHWTRDAWRHGSIISLAVIDGQVLALAARCTASNGCGQTATLLRRPLAGGRWRVAAYLGAPDLMSLTDSIATQARVAAVVAGSKVLRTTDGGRTFRGRATPCDSVRKGMATSVAVTSRHGLALLCTGQGFTGHTVKWVYVSSDSGRSWTLAGRPSTLGDGGVISAADPGHLSIATFSAASWLFFSADGGARWSIVRTQLDGGMGWADLGFTTLTDGVVVRGPAYTDGNTDHRHGWLLLTNDAGAHWHRVHF